MPICIMKLVDMYTELLHVSANHVVILTVVIDTSLCTIMDSIR